MDTPSLSSSKLKIEEELQKRNTDCVYFLASPLTCKKGLDCEYRHNEIARLNPRDCWYWLAGNCFNPTCGFRHPPLDAHVTEAPSESASLPCQSSLSVNKANVPCYFYFNGFCNKGDRCSFLHGLDGSAPTGKSSKTASAITDALPFSENKTFAGNGTVPPPTETHPNPSETTSKQSVDVRVQPKDDLLQSAPKRIPQQSASPQISLSEGEAVAGIKLDSMGPAEGFLKTDSYLYTDWRSEEQVDDHIELEERLESSPGFDVLVDDKNGEENLGYEDNPEYLLAINREHRELKGHFLGYDFEDPVEFDPMIPESGPYECEIFNAHNYLDNENILDNVREHPIRARGRVLDSILSRKRKLFPVKLALDDHNADLRDYLRKRRVVDVRSIHTTRRHESSRLMGQIQERHRSHAMGHRLHGLLASEFGKNYIESHGDGDKRTLPNGANRRGWPRHSKSNILGQRLKEKRLAKRKSHLSAVSRKPSSRERRSSQFFTTFTGPKSLAEIKEEKKKAEENGDHFGKMGHSSRTLTDFQGPKPLSEILKEKRRLGTVSDGDTCSC